MTRKDYVAIADAITRARAVAHQTSTSLAMLRGINIAVQYIADALAADNPRFDRARFIAAATREVQA